MNRTRPFAVLLATALLMPATASAQTIPAPYDTSYHVASLGSVPGVPLNYGGVTFKADDPNMLLIGGNANISIGKIYQIAVRRDASDHIVGFQGTASVFANAPNIDGGLTYGPGGVLFYTRYPVNGIGQIVPGGSGPAKLIDLDLLGLTFSVGSVAFVPEGFPGAGSMKTLSFQTGAWNDITYLPDLVGGTYNLLLATRRGVLTGQPEGVIYVPLGSPEFAAASVVVSEYTAGNIVSYQVDGSGDPIVATRKVFVAGVQKPVGATFDPVSSDFLFSSFGATGGVMVVGGFAPLPSDTDQDGVPDEADNCATVANADQVDTDSDQSGDACDADDDNDGFTDAVDAFPLNPLEHADTDGDGVGDNGDVCPLDASNDGDGDLICAGADLCPAVYDPDQADFDADGIGDLCDSDWDGDGVADAVDLCIGFDDSVDADDDGIPDGPAANGEPCDTCPHDAQNDAEHDGLCADADNCPVDGNADQADFDTDGAGDPCDPDDDNDTVADAVDTFPHDPTEWADTDLDGVGDNGDLCSGNDAAGDTDLDGTCDDVDALPTDPTETADADGDGVGDNADQFDADPTEWDDTDLDGVGDNSDACAGDDASGDTDDDLVCDDSDLCPTDPLDADADADLICDVVDTCVGAANVDSDGDQVCDDLDLCQGNDATDDTDGDGFCDGNDLCPVDADPDQTDSDGDGIGDACEADTDKDGVDDDVDVCAAVFDPDQANNDLDALGDACDLDDDNDGVLDLLDNCALLANPTQANTDHDALGDACDGDDDADGVVDLVDQCAGTPLNVLFDTRGCSGAQGIVLTCGGPRCSSFWGQLQYVGCVVNTASTARNAGLITTREKGVIVKNAVFSCWWCGQ